MRRLRIFYKDRIEHVKGLLGTMGDPVAAQAEPHTQRYHDITEKLQ